MTTPQEYKLPFAPLVADWFEERFGRPTQIQQKAWPRVAAGEHLLISAPTGSGKTLTAFLWSLNRLIQGDWATGTTRILYVSPLKALNNDVRRNLLEPLSQLRARFAASGQPFPNIQVLTRSGDTPSSQRRKMLKTPPEILITTPESLNLLISSKGARHLFMGLKSLILDEIHALFGSKRGVHLITAVERLAFAHGEFQRIALSATVRPMEKVAAFVGGYQLTEPTGDPVYQPRPVAVVQSLEAKRYAMAVRYPDEILDRSAFDSIWDPLAEVFRGIIVKNRATLFFTNSRRLSEKLTFLTNQGQPFPLAYSHHGSLSKELRLEVESRLKRGELKAIFATSSLELGIDIGSLDEVVLVQSPPSVSAAIQRIGRAGHRVAAVSRGILFPSHDGDILKGAVLSRAVMEKRIEPLKPIREPLDVLAQVIVSMAGEGSWPRKLMLAVLRCSDPFHNLKAKAFDLVLEMLAGRYAGTRIRELKAKIAIDRIEDTITVRKGALLSLYLGGGTIPDRGLFQLRHAETNVRIGELDEEYVWEARKGQLLTLGTQNWQIRKITHNDVFVLPAGAKGAVPPFWRAEENRRDLHLSHLMGDFLAEADRRMGEETFAADLRAHYCLDANGAGRLIDHLHNQRRHTGTPLPHRHHLVVEHLNAEAFGAPGNQVVIHAIWGGRVNKPFAMALESAWQAASGLKIEIHASDDNVVLLLPEAVDSDDLLGLVRSDNVEDLLTRRMEGSGVFGAMFRECAGRALLLGRRKFGERVPLWLNRLRAQKLFDAVRPYGNFPIMLEAWRCCLQDELDLEGLKGLLGELESGAITWSETHCATPSPMARAHTFRQINEYMYRDDSSRGSRERSLQEGLLEELIFGRHERPVIPAGIIADFEAKRQRIWPGYAPDSELELIEWVKERLAIPALAWEHLLQRMEADHGIDPQVMASSPAVKEGLIRLIPSNKEEGGLIVAREAAAEIVHSLYARHLDMGKQGFQLMSLDLGPIQPAQLPHIAGRDGHDSLADDAAALVGQWLSYFGPIPAGQTEKMLGLPKDVLDDILSDLVEAKQVVSGVLVESDQGIKLCDAKNYEILLRIKRSAASAGFTPLTARELPLYLAAHQGLTVTNGGSCDELAAKLQQLAFLPQPAGVWETDILPARLRPYRAHWLDTLLQEEGFLWLGAGRRRVLFGHVADLDFLQGYASPSDVTPEKSNENPSAASLFPETEGRYRFETLVEKSGLPPEKLSMRLWEHVWEGAVANDSAVALRRGIQHRFKLPAVTSHPGANPYRGRRRTRGMVARDLRRRRASLPSAGNWYRVSLPQGPEDSLEADELVKDRIRLLLDRYGILFPELVTGELTPFRWSHIFRMLRLMELSGEVMGGLFFDGIPGPQFITPAGFRRLCDDLSRDAIFWMGATDPASLCGKKMGEIATKLPKRMAGNHLVYHGPDLVLVSRQKGRHLSFYVDIDNKYIEQYLMVLDNMVKRDVTPRSHITIETINGKAALQSPYLGALRGRFEVVVEPKSVTCYPRTV